MKNVYRLIFFSALVLTACSTKDEITITSDLELGESQLTSPTIVSLQKAVKTLNLKLRYVDANSTREADLLGAVEKGLVDIAIVKNDVAVQSSYSNVRTLLPLFPDVLLVLCKNDPGKLTVQELFGSQESAMIIDKEEEKEVIDLFLKKNGANPESLKQIHHTDSSQIIEALNEHDVLVMFASLNSISVRNILRTWNGQLYTLDDPALRGQGSIVDGFCLAYPKAVPYIIPKGTYGKWPLNPVLTFAVYDVMVCRNDFDVNLAYDAVKTIYDMGSILAEDDFEFGLLDPNIESHRFSFPLHQATTKYIKRDQPTFWERESELMGLGISLVVLLSGGITTLFRYLKQRRKDRVDIYYLKVLQVSDKARASKSLEEKKKYLKDLHEIRNNAFDQLVRERLDANESFTIFTSLLNAAISELENDLRALKENALEASL
jgi:TRAP-type uncharacterized transport system substrate-binding protein